MTGGAVSFSGMPSPRAYWQASRAPRHSLLFALPLLLLYEALAFALSRDAMLGVRNGADVMLKSAFVWLGGRRGLVLFGVLLVGVGAAFVRRDVRRGGRIEPRLFPLMLLESVAWALAFGTVTATVTALLLRGVPLAAGLLPGMDLPTQLMISLGAGLYEELLFRVLLVGGLMAVATKGLGLSKGPAAVGAVALSALVFSAFHYVGPYGDPFTVPSFTFRALAGVWFSGLYVTRGFGITAWAHALYDVWLLA